MNHWGNRMTFRAFGLARLRSASLAALAVLLAVAAAVPGAAQQAAPARQPDVVFVPTSTEVVDAMLKLAKVTSNDVVYDLGSGDGRIVIAAAKMYGAHGIGIDIDPERVREATANARSAGVADKVTFRTEDLFTADISPATVVMLYLSPLVNSRLAPRLMTELKPGTRIVSHAFDLGSWKPQQQIKVSDRPIFLWTVAPPRSKRS
jgi:precorrin-6B methylase 2